MVEILIHCCFVERKHMTIFRACDLLGFAIEEFHTTFFAVDCFLLHCVSLSVEHLASCTLVEVGQFGVTKCLCVSNTHQQSSSYN